MSATDTSGYEDLQGEVREMALPPMETVENVYSDRDYVVSFEHLEFSCVCPKTGLPDFARVTLEFVPDKLLVELKSLKLYLNGYRNVGVFHEHVVNKILDDLCAAIAPRRATVTGDFNIRGGIHAVIRASTDGADPRT